MPESTLQSTRAADAARRVDLRRLRRARRRRRRHRGLRASSLRTRAFCRVSVLTIDGERGEPVSLRAKRAARRGLRAGVGDRVGGAARVVRRTRSRREAHCRNRSDREVESVLELDLASDFADIFAVKRVEDLGAPGNSEVGAVAARALAGRTHRRVRGRRLPGADARASGPGARRDRRWRCALPVATRARRALAARRRGAVAR